MREKSNDSNEYTQKVGDYRLEYCAIHIHTHTPLTYETDEIKALSKVIDDRLRRGQIHVASFFCFTPIFILTSYTFNDWQIV